MIWYQVWNEVSVTRLVKFVLVLGAHEPLPLLFSCYFGPNPMSVPNRVRDGEAVLYANELKV